MTISTPVIPEERGAAGPPEPAADRFMRKLLRAESRNKSVEYEQSAHRGFRLSLFLSAIRCLITYVVLPFLLPLISVAGVVAAPIGILLCVVAAVSGITSVRRFWISDHRGKWMYTGFIAIVLVILTISIIADIAKIASGL